MDEQTEKEANGDLRECAGRLMAAALQIQTIGTFDHPWEQLNNIGAQIAELRNALQPLLSWYRLYENQAAQDQAIAREQLTPPPTPRR